MSRRARRNVATYTYFQVCVRGNNRQPIFLDDADRFHYLFLLEKYRARFGLVCFAFCLMTNHVHLLVLTPSIAILSKAMHALNSAYVKYFNRRHKRTGHLFEDRFESWVIRDEKHLLNTVEYIENNPVKEGMAPTASAYAWSSAAGDGCVVSLSQVRT